MRKLGLGLVLAAMLIGGEAAAMTGDGLKKYCQSHETSDGYGVCIGYIVAIYDVLRGGEIAISGYRACVPDEATHDQRINVVREFLHGYPQLLRYNANEIVAAALANAFPCM